MLDYMLENTDPGMLYEMDVYWATYGHAAPVDYFKKYPGRFKLLHIKDLREIGQSGMVGFAAIFNNADTAGVENYYVEIEEYSGDPEEGIRQSSEYLNNAPFVKASYKKKDTSLRDIKTVAAISVATVFMSDNNQMNSGVMYFARSQPPPISHM